MADGLSYFKQVYGEVPDWVKKMHSYSPKMLDYYTDFRGEAFKENALSKKEKDQFIASANAGRLYQRSMLYHTKAAVGNGSSVEELVEHFLVAYLYKGDEALRLAVQAIEYAAELTGQNAPHSPLRAEASAVELLERIIAYLPAGSVTSSKKNLNMVAQYITELDGKGAQPWIQKARDKKATEAELADVGYICILTAGIPAWFEISDSLLEN